MRSRILGFLAFLVYRLLSATWRYSVFEPKELRRLVLSKESFVLAHWHGDELALLYLIPRYKIATMASKSADGQIMHSFIAWMGGVTRAGSSSRAGASALIGLIRLAKQGHPISLAVDGPKGPIHEVKPGIFELAVRAKVPIFFPSLSVDRKWHFRKSWNQAYLPKFFAKIQVTWSGPYQLREEGEENWRNNQIALAAALQGREILSNETAGDA